MCFLSVVVTAYLLAVVKDKVSNVEDAKNYSTKCVYIGNDFLSEFDTTLMQFQERYNLLLNGELNENKKKK